MIKELAEEDVDFLADEFAEEDYEEGLNEIEQYVPNKNELKDGANQIIRSMLKSLPLQPDMSVLDFSEAFRILPTSNATRGGMLYKAHSYQKDVLLAMTNPKYDRIVIMFAAQTGKSEMLNNAIAYFMYMDPAEILMVLPTEEAAEEYVKRRIDPMIRDNHYLKSLVNSKDSRNNVMNKYFVGGSLSFVGSASPTKLASKPIRILVCDEIDRYLDTREGSTLKLAFQRTSTFARKRKILLASTPTIKNHSPIEEEFQNSAQHYFYVPCFACGKEQVLDFEQVIYSTPEDARYECIYCRAHWTELDRRRSVKRGRWIQTEEAKTKKSIGFHLSALYSPYLKLSDIVQEKVLISSERDKQVFENTVLCKSYEPISVNFEPEVLEKEYEDYNPDSIPDQINYVTCAVDVQQNRLELEFRGWARHAESWGIEYIIQHGDTSRQNIWQELYKLICARTHYNKKSGGQAILAAIAIDCGYRTDEVYNFCLSISPRSTGLNVIPVKGASRTTTMLGFYNIGYINNALKNRPSLTINTFQCKYEIYSRLLPRPESGFRLTHFASPSFGYHPEYYRQLTAERLQQTTTKTGEVKYEFIKERARNEALDIFVYGFAIANYFEKVIMRNITSRK